MSLFETDIRSSLIQKHEIENVVREEQETKLLDNFKRTAGLALYAYDEKNDKLIKVDEVFDGELYLLKRIDGTLYAKAIGHTTATVDSRHHHFEALNLKTAQRKVDRYKAGKIKTLSNLKPPVNKSIKLF